MKDHGFESHSPKRVVNGRDITLVDRLSIFLQKPQRIIKLQIRERFLIQMVRHFLLSLGVESLMRGLLSEQPSASTYLAEWMCW